MLRDVAERLSATFLRRQHAPRTIQRTAGLVRGRLASLDHAGIEGMQLHRLRRLLRHVQRRNPWYRDRLREAGIEPADVRTPADVRRLPTTSGDDLREEGRLRCVPVERIAASFASSGTTGEPKRIDFGFEDVQVLANAGAIGLRLLHGEGPIVAALALPLDKGLWVGWRQSMWILERAGGLALPLGAEDPDAVVHWMQRFGPNVLASSPSFALRLIERAKARNYRPALERVVLGAEVLDEDRRAAVADYFRADTLNQYATTESGVGLTTSMPNEVAVTVNELHMLVEILDPESGAPADEGEIVYTTLTRRAMPLVRYRSGDRGRWSDAQGEWPFRAVEVLGRLDSILVIAGSNIGAQVIAELVREQAGPDAKLAVEVARREGADLLRLRVAGDIDEQRLRRRLTEKYPRLQDHLDVGSARLEVESGADLGDQSKPLAVRDER